MTQSKRSAMQKKALLLGALLTSFHLYGCTPTPNPSGTGTVPSPEASTIGRSKDGNTMPSNQTAEDQSAQSLAAVPLPSTGQTINDPVKNSILFPMRTRLHSHPNAGNPMYKKNNTNSSTPFSSSTLFTRSEKPIAQQQPANKSNPSVADSTAQSEAHQQVPSLKPTPNKQTAEKTTEQKMKASTTQIIQKEKAAEAKKHSPALNASTPLPKSLATAKRLTLSQLAKKYPQQFRLHGPVHSNRVALTFDDAPDRKYTPQVLDILKKHHVRATFFLLGNQAEQHPDVTKRIANEGHVIANHSYSHRLFTKLSPETFQSQITRTQDILSGLIGYKPKLLRPPYGEITEGQLLQVAEQGMLVVNWNVDSLDWKQLKAQQVIANVTSHVKAGSIILQHSGGGPSQDLSGTVQALPIIIQYLQSHGYNLVTLPELLQVSSKIS